MGTPKGDFPSLYLGTRAGVQAEHTVLTKVRRQGKSAGQLKLLEL